MSKYKIEEIRPGTAKIVFTPALSGQETAINLDNPLKSGQFTKFFTATTQMKDCIGNIVALNNNKCIVKGIYQGKLQEIKNIIISFAEPKIGERVMVTEHLSIDGKFELLATKHRILQGDLNFINCGWQNGKKFAYYRIDVITGDTKLFVTGV